MDIHKCTETMKIIVDSVIRRSWLIIIIIIILFIERHIQQAVRVALQQLHNKAALSVIINIQVDYFLKIIYII